MDRITKICEYDYIKRNSVIRLLCEKYPFIKNGIIGKSILGKNIVALKIGSADSYSVVAAAFHGSERITSNILLMYIENLCDAIVNDSYIGGFGARAILRSRGVIFVPCVNPDGCDISLLGETAFGTCKNNFRKICKNDFTHWNANARGVDINHNFDADWENLRIKEREHGIYGPSPTRFGGYKSHSEPETMALVKLCCETNIRQITALHTQGEVIYWKYGDINVPKAKQKAEVMATSSGYKLDNPVEIADGGGFKDWFISKFNRPGFTVEMGKGVNPLPITEAPEIYKKTERLLTLCSFT